MVGLVSFLCQCSALPSCQHHPICSLSLLTETQEQQVLGKAAREVAPGQGETRERERGAHLVSQSSGRKSEPTTTETQQRPYPT